MCAGGHNSMRISSRPRWHRLRRAAHLAAQQGGAIMMFVLLASLLIGMVTLGVMRMVAGDISEGFGGLEAVQAFNIAEAGHPPPNGQLPASGTTPYTGETITVNSRSNTPRP